MTDTSESIAAASSPGERLKQAREQAGFSIEKVAKDLYLDAQVISLMESNRFKDLGAPVYAKGYIRKYARLVGLAEEDVLQRYQQLGDVTMVADPIPAAMGSVPESRKPLPRWILWVVVVLIVAAAGATLWNFRSTKTTETAVGGNEQSTLISKPLTAPGVANGATSSIEAKTPPNVASAAAPLSLRFSFSGDSWVEVYDANNQQVLYETGAANGVREITATPPLRVVLGSANAVTVQANSKEVAVPESHIDSGVARFVINASGSVE